MSSYNVVVRHAVESVIGVFEAETAEQALAFAHAACVDCPGVFRFQIDEQQIEELAIEDSHGQQCAVWRSESRQLQLSERDLLRAAETVFVRWETGDLAEAMRDLSEALIRAKSASTAVAGVGPTY